MKNKIIAIILSIFGCGLLFVVTCVLIMFLAPGTEIFGIRYVAHGISDYHFSEPIEGFSGDLYIEAENVPIKIVFNDHYSYEVEFHQEFIGFTRSKLKKANLDMVYENKNLYLKTSEIQKFIYAQSGKGRYELTVSLPEKYFESGMRSVYINAKNSNVKINGKSDLKDFVVKTGGGYNLADSAHMVVRNNFEISTSKLLEIENNLDVSNVNLTSTGNNINIKIPIAGKITARTKGGDLKFIACDSLDFSSISGAVRGWGENIATVRKDVKVKTEGGSVDLGDINTASAGDNIYLTEITTVGGSIRVKSMDHGVVSSTRGRINIASAVVLAVYNKTGNITVNNVYGVLQVNGQNGKITLGEGGEINNVTVSATSGEIIAYNVVGICDLKSTSNNVTVVGKDLAKATLHSGRKLSASGLKGEVVAYSKANMNLAFSEISGNVSISSGSRADEINIDATCSKIGTLGFSLKSSKGTRAKVISGDETVMTESTISSPALAGQFTITAETSYAKITLKLSA